jgi:biotin carboxyl carrier protein
MVHDGFDEATGDLRHARGVDRPAAAMAEEPQQVWEVKTAFSADRGPTRRGRVTLRRPRVARGVQGTAARADGAVAPRTPVKAPQQTALTSQGVDMASAAMAATPPTVAARSGDGYVVPHLVEVTAAAHGIVTSLAVAPRDVVRSGQLVAVLQRLSSTGERGCDQLAVIAPVSGIVTRCWAAPGDVVSGRWPILAIASSQDVMVVAHVSSDRLPRLHRGAQVEVLLGEAERATVAGAIVSVIDGLELGVQGDGTSGRACVVVSLPTAPAAAVWPGSFARVDLPW